MEGIMKKVLVLVLLVFVIVSSAFSRSIKPFYEIYNPENTSFSLDEDERIIKVFFDYFPEDNEFFKTALPKESRAVNLLKEAFSLTEEELSLKENAVFIGLGRSFFISYTYEISIESLNWIMDAERTY